MESLYIAKSKLRQDLLTLYFTNPSKKYYLRELERLLNYSAGSLRRELLRYQKDNLFTTEKVGNLLFYSLNTKHPLYKELKSIVFKVSGIVARLKEELTGVSKIAVAFIYGSFARGKEKTASDIDVMIIGNPKTMDVVDRIMNLENKFQREINFVIYTKSDFAKKKQDTGFVKDILNSPKIFLIGDEDEL